MPSPRYGLVVLDLASGRERFLAFPFPQAGEAFGHAWSPDSRQVALVRGPVTDGDRFPAQLCLLEVASGRYLLYGVAGLSLVTRRVDISGKGAPARIGQFDALSGRQGDQRL
jgi:hypothetical protein